MGILFLSSGLAIEAGYQLGRRRPVRASASWATHIGAIQDALLAVLALLLGFTFSLSLQRYDSRSEAVIDEANAIGTAYLRSELLPDVVRGEVQQRLRTYLDGRVRESTVPLSQQAERQALLAQASQDQAMLWRLVRQAAAADNSPVTTGLFVEALNNLIDAYGRRNAALDRHVPEAVMLLLYGVFLSTWWVVGYIAGSGSHRPSAVAYMTLLLMLIVIFIIVDLDRPRRGVIEISHASLTELQAGMAGKEGP